MKPEPILRYLLRETMGMIFAGVALFWSAGRLDWWPGWAMLTVVLGWSMGTMVVILRANPDLLSERLGPRKDAKRWDTAILGVAGLATLGRLVIAWLDQRFGWSGPFPIVWQIGAVAACAVSYALVVWATACNAFFSQVARIQSERGHVVITRGPYRWVRHPAYLGMLVFELTVSFLLASWWAFIPSGLNVIMFIVRTALEDQMLQAELPGYADYALRVQYRLLPGVW